LRFKPAYKKADRLPIIRTVRYYGHQGHPNSIKNINTPSIPSNPHQNYITIYPDGKKGKFFACFFAVYLYFPTTCDPAHIFPCPNFLAPRNHWIYSMAKATGTANMPKPEYQGKR
jgi:hypothetical protein